MDGHEAMSVPSNIPELAVPDKAAADAAEFERCLEHAAEMVQNFADDSAPSVLDALLSLGEQGARQDAQRALRMARGVTKQAKVLHTEVDRFLSTKRR